MIIRFNFLIIWCGTLTSNPPQVVHLLWLTFSFALAKVEFARDCPQGSCRLPSSQEPSAIIDKLLLMFSIRHNCSTDRSRSGSSHLGPVGSHAGPLRGGPGGPRLAAGVLRTVGWPVRRPGRGGPGWRTSGGAAVGRPRILGTTAPAGGACRKNRGLVASSTGWCC